MIVMRNNQQWKRLLALALCIVQCMALVIPAVNVQADTSEIMEATSVAVPEEYLSDISTTVTMKEEVDSDGNDSYWWGTASQATAKIGEPITGISDRYSVIFDSPIDEGYGHGGKTSSYFEVNAGWTDFDMGNQDLMFYLELPEAASSIRMQHICMDSWSKYPAPTGMTYQYLEADGRTWEEGVIDQNKEIALTAGFKGFVRLLVNTAPNATDYADAVLDLQTFGFRISDFGGSYGAAKLGGVWFVDKGEAYMISVDGGEDVALTSADPLPVPGENEEVVWTGDVMTGAYVSKESGEIGAASTLLKLEEDKQWAGIATQATMLATESITLIGDQKAAVLDSPIGEGYFNESGKTYPIINLGCSWVSLDTTTQDLMFYIELPENSSELRPQAFTCNSWGFWVAPAGMQYQYLAMDSREWKSGSISTDGNKTMTLTPGFKGFVRLKVDTANNAASFPNTTLTVQSMTFMVDRFGGDNGPVKISGVWAVSKEDTRYIKVDGGETIRMTNPAEPKWIKGTLAGYDSATAGETSAWISVAADNAWAGINTQATLTASNELNVLGNTKGTIIDSPISEGYFNEYDSKTYVDFSVSFSWKVFVPAQQDLMFYIELPEGSSSLRIPSICCNGWNIWIDRVGMQYQYLSMDSWEWVSGTIDGNSQINVPAGFKGYIRLKTDTATNIGDNLNAELQAQFITIRPDKFGVNYGPIKLGGAWIVSKEDYVDISIDGAEGVYMTNAVAPTPVLNATSVSVEDPAKLWDTKVTVSGESQAQISVVDPVTKISNRKAVVINSEAAEGYNNGVSPVINVQIDATVDTAAQDMMLYVELPASAQSLRVNGNATTYKYLGVMSGNWLEANVAENNQIDLPAGFKGYIRLAVDALSFEIDSFGGDNGAFKLGGVWLVSKTDSIKVSVDGAEAANLGKLTDPVGNVDMWHLILHDDIAVNFYVNVNENILDTAQIAVTLGGETAYHAVKDLSVNEYGNYTVRTNVSAAQMNDSIAVQVVNGEQTSAVQTYTVAQYANTLLNDPWMSNYYRLCKEMLNYGGAAQMYFDHNTENLANEGLIGAGANIVPETAATEMTIDGAAEGVSFYGASLVYRNKVAVRYYFNISGEAAAHSFTCGETAVEPVAKDGLYYVEIAGINPQDLDKSFTVTVDGSLSVSYSPMNYIVRMNTKGSDELKALLKAMYNYHLAAKQVILAQDDPARYDLKVTTFNVGQFYHGVSNLDVYGAQVNAHPGITPDHVLRAYDQWMAALPMHDADVICAQEFRDIFYINNQDTEDTSDDVILTTEEVMADYFQVESFTGATKNGTVPMWMGMLTPNSGRYQLKNITNGHLCADTPQYARAYMKGYVTVNGHDIAIYNVHLQPESSGLGNAETRRKAYLELIELAKQDEYVIIMGDMNAEYGAEEYEVMTEAGFSMANCGRFGAFDTYEYEDVEPIDNIFVTSNIEIAYAECEQDKVGGSDHFPMSAYLMIKDEA